MRRVFVNLTSHRLMDEQIEEAKKFGVEEFYNAEDVLPEDIVSQVRQCPDTIDELGMLAYNIVEKLIDFAKQKKVHAYVHLPVGSPALMWIFPEIWPYFYATPVFSHTEREVVEHIESDGSVVKKSRFKFKGYIVFNGSIEG